MKNPLAILLVSFLTWSAALPSTAAAANPSLTGSYKYVGGAAEVNALYASVESVVKKMSIFSRGIARKRLRKPNMPAAELDLSIDPKMISVSHAGQNTVAAPRDGAPTQWKSSEGTFTVTYAFEDGALLQTMVGKSSHTTNRFVLDGDGTTLNVHTKIISSHLPGSVEFDMTYQRK